MTKAATIPRERTPARRGKSVETDSSVALYRQVKDYIAMKIQDESLRAGDRLPSENELVTQFGISRMTVNRALRELAEQGRIVRHAGLGSFVAEHKPQSTLLQIAHLANEIRQRGHDYRCSVVLNAREAAPMDVAIALGVQTGESVFHTVCVHMENEVPVQLEDRYVNPGVAPGYGEQDFAQLQPSEYLRRNVPYDEIEHVVDAVLPSAEQAARLQMPPSQPCLLLTRRTWTRATPVTLVRCLHPADRYRLGSRYRADGHPTDA